MGGSKISIPPPPPSPNYGNVTKEAILAQTEVAPDVYAAESSPIYGQPAYANLQNQINEILASGQMDLLAEYYPEIAGIEADYMQRLRAGEIAQLQSPEVGLAATQRAFNQLTPGYAEAAANLGQFAAQQTAAAASEPTYTAYEQGVAGPQSGQFVGQIGSPSADLSLGGMRAFQPGQALGGLQEYQVGQDFLGQPSYEAGQILGGLNEYQVGQQFLSQPAFQAGAYSGMVGGPKLRSGLGSINEGLVEQYMEQMPGVQDIAEQLTQQASEELAAGRELTPEETRAATQAAREAYAARGTALGNQSIGAEILARAELGDKRLQERQAMAAQAANLASQLYSPALQQTFARQAGAEQYGLGAQGQFFTQQMSREELDRLAQAQGFQQAGTIEQALAGAQEQAYRQRMGAEELFRTAQAQQFGQEAAKEQALAGAQGQAFTQRMGKEDLARAAQGQEYTQRMGLQELGLSEQGQQFSQAMGREQLQATTQNQAFQQALQRTQQGLAAQQALQGLQAGRAQMGAAGMSALQQVQAPILQAFYRQGVLTGAVPQAMNFAQTGQQLAGPALFNPESAMAFQSAYVPYQASIAQSTAAMQANAAASAGRSGMIGSIGGGLLGAGGMIGGAMIL